MTQTVFEPKHDTTLEDIKILKLKSKAEFSQKAVVLCHFMPPPAGG